MRTACYIVFLFFFYKSISAQGIKPANLDVRIPAGFLKNVGQVRGLQNQPVKFVYYRATINNQQVFVTNYGISILLARPKKQAADTTLQKVRLKEKKVFDTSDITWELERIDIVLKNGVISKENITTRQSPGSAHFNFYPDSVVSEDATQLMQNEILIKNVYQGIDWKIYIQHSEDEPAHLKYDFIVHPGADISSIKLKYSNNASVILKDGELIAQSRMGQILEKKPFSYIKKSRKEVPVRYTLHKNTVSFKAANYDRSETIIIDPSVYWLTYLSAVGSGSTYHHVAGNDIETDAAGNIFVQLSARFDTPFPTKNPGDGIYYQDHKASPDGSMIMMKFTPQGQLLWSTYFGNGVKSLCMTVNRSGEIFAMGTIAQSIPSHPTINTTFPLVQNGGYFDGKEKSNFITRFSNNGKLLWCSYYTSFQTFPTDMSYDEDGNVYITGTSTNYEFPTIDPGGGAFVLTNPQHPSIMVFFIAQFDAQNNLTWSTRIEGDDYDPHARISTDRNGNIYLGGNVRSQNYPVVDAGGYFNNNSSNYGSVVSRFNAQRQLIWSTYLPDCTDLVADDSSNLYVVGGRYIMKFDGNTNLVFKTSVNASQMHFWHKINYDFIHEKIQLLGVMNDFEYGFPTINTTCNGSFYNNGISPNKYFSATGPIFGTLEPSGVFTYLSLADWIPEEYNVNEFSIDNKGDVVYLFGDNRGGGIAPNPDLTDPGNGAYFDPNCCEIPDHDLSALLMKLINDEISVDTIVSQPVGCECDGSVNLIPECGTAPFKFLWSDGITAANRTNLCPGDYWVRVTDVNQNSKKINITIRRPEGSVTSINTNVSPENCGKSNGIIKIEGVDGSFPPFTFSKDSIHFQTSESFTNLPSGDYVITVNDSKGCTSDHPVHVPSISGPSGIEYLIENSSCSAADGTLRVTGVQGGVVPYLYTLVGKDTNVTGNFAGLEAGSFVLKVSDAAGCSFSETIQIEKHLPPTSANYIVDHDHCGQSIGSVEVKEIAGGTGPFYYSTDNISYTNGKLTNLSAGNYPLFIKDSKGCILQTGPVIIKDEGGPNDIQFETAPAICGKLTGELTVTGVSGGSAPYFYAVDNYAFLSSGKFQSIQPGMHTIIVKDQYGCMDSAVFEIKFKPPTVVEIYPQDTTVCFGDSVHLMLKGETDQLRDITWNIPFKGGVATYIAVDDQRIIVTANDINNCPVQQTAFVTIKACNAPEQCIAIPNAFTPNHDGINDKIKPIVNGCKVHSIHFKIYDRFGNVVFESTDLNNGWNGYYRGEQSNVGVYTYVLNYVLDDGIVRSQKGVISLIR